jgi:amino acid adenylation domain-containing protein
MNTSSSTKPGGALKPTTTRANVIPGVDGRQRRAVGPVPVSFAQQRLWFLEQLEPNSALYNVSRAMQIIGPLNLSALRASLDNLIARHEPLRTTFLNVNGEPAQLVEKKRPINLTTIDLSARPGADCEAEAERLLDEHSRRPFDLRRDLMLRAVLLRLSQEKHILLLTMHHIASDGWSMSILFRELASFYESFQTGKPSSLPDLPIQYQDYALWQRQWLKGEVLETQLAYWKQQLRGAPALLELPTDRPRPAVQSFQGARQLSTFPQALLEALKALSRQERATLYMIMMAAFQTLLHRYSGQNTIVVGSPIAGRNYKETEELIGFFVNTLVLRTEFSGNPTFKELIARVRKVAIDAYEHQDIPFEKLVEELHPDRNLSYSPLFQVALAFQNVPLPVVELAGLHLIPVELNGGTSKFDLTLYMTEESETLKAGIEYTVDLFNPPTIERMLGHYQTLLESIVADPNRRISDLAMLTFREEHQLLIEWNDTRREYPRNKCIHQLVEEQAEKVPEAIAITFANQQLTYGELNRRANRLARYLKKLDVGPEVLVGVFMDRSLEMVVGLLGILKAGGAYVPLDPGYPQERLKFMIEDTAAPVLLTQQQLLKNLPEHGARVISLDRDWDAISRESDENLPARTSPEDLAYVIYTSGSTGNPKGVEVLHRGITRLVAGTEYARFDSSEIFLQLAPISFDASTFELWGALAHGSQCVLFPGRIPAIHELRAALDKYRITTLWLTASLFNTIIEQDPESLSGIRQLLTGGEALSVRHVRQALSTLPNTTIINGYGPTESTTFACCYTIPRQLDGALRSIPIGRPIANTEIFILDPHLNPVPVGVSGEIYIGGLGLARAYLKRPEATAEKFIPNPFSSEAGARLYRTGDLARYSVDGNIEFLGRLDDQVKIRGFRIEPGEIEHALKRHPSIQNAVVLAREDRPGDKNLVAYVVAARSRSVSANELKTFLSEKLPDYMLPSVYEFLDAIPLSLNGKVDRLSLPAPDRTTAHPAGGYQAPRNAVEETLAQIWAELLNVDRVGIHDDFFDLGGHSLLAVRVTNLIEKRLGTHFGVTSIFQAPTIEQLGLLINQAIRAAEPSSLVPLQTKGGKPPFFWIHGENSDALLPSCLGPEQPLYGLQHQSQDGSRALYTSVEDIAAHYLDEIRSVQREGPYYLGGYCFGGLLAFEMTRQLQQQKQTVALVALLNPAGETRSPHNGSARSSSLSDNLRGHVRALSPLHAREKWSYLTERAVQKVKGRVTSSIIAPVNQMTRPLICKTCERFGIAIPASMRSSYILDIYRQALRAHTAKPLDVNMVLFVTNDFAQDLRSDWCKRSIGRLAVYPVPGDHATVLSEPYVGGWAEKLRSCLNSAQTIASNF